MDIIRPHRSTADATETPKGAQESKYFYFSESGIYGPQKMNYFHAMNTLHLSLCFNGGGGGSAKTTLDERRMGKRGLILSTLKSLGDRSGEAVVPEE